SDHDHCPTMPGSDARATSRMTMCQKNKERRVSVTKIVITSIERRFVSFVTFVACESAPITN
ncbi:MAG: hypothetical protein ACRD26_03185, partial [Vicinamibacterales bacterium]